MNHPTPAAMRPASTSGRGGERASMAIRESPMASAAPLKRRGHHHTVRSQPGEVYQVVPDQVWKPSSTGPRVAPSSRSGPAADLQRMSWSVPLPPG